MTTNTRRPCLSHAKVDCLHASHSGLCYHRRPSLPYNNPRTRSYTLYKVPRLRSSSLLYAHRMAQTVTCTPAGHMSRPIQNNIMSPHPVQSHEFHTRDNRGLKSCLVKVSSRSVKNCRFCSTLKMIDFSLFYMLSALCTRLQCG